MALADEVQDRISATRLVQLTNQDGEAATTLNTTRLARAVTDVTAEFGLEAGVEYDGTNKIHVDIAISGVIAKLQEYGGNGGEWAAAHRQRYVEKLATLRTRQGVPSTSSSNLTPATEAARRPKLDGSSFTGYSSVANAPGNGLGAPDEDEVGE